MSTSWQPQEPEPEWNQPPFSPGFQEPEPESENRLPPSAPPRPALPDVVSGSVLVPNAPIPSPGMVESTLKILAALIWPVTIAVLIFGGGSWVFGIVFAIVASGVLRQVTHELKRRRVANARRVTLPPPNDLR